LRQCRRLRREVSRECGTGFHRQFDEANTVGAVALDGDAGGSEEPSGFAELLGQDFR